MAELGTVEVIKVAADAELQRARKRVAELELAIATHGAGGRVVSRAVGYVVLACVGVLALAATAAIVHRLFAWGWP